ncbi:MAG: hypothetical protein ACI8SE_001293 [Bacteroidia bacterium]|jgi:hypothetical protein
MDLLYLAFSINQMNIPLNKSKSMKMRGITSLFFLILAVHISNAQCTAIAADSDLKCKPASETMTLGGSPSAFGGVPPYTYHWTLIDGYPRSIYTVLDRPNSANPNANFGTNAVLLLTVTDSNKAQCFDTVQLVKADAVRHNMTNQCWLRRGDSIKLSTAIGIETISDAPFQYLWSPSTGLSDSTDLTTWAKPLDSIQYHLTITNKRGCTFYDQFTINVDENPAPINSELQNNDWTIMYLMNTKTISIRPPRGLKHSVNASIIDMWGVQRMYFARLNSDTDTNVTDLPDGMYVLLIQGFDDELIVFKKIMILN